MNKGLKHTTDTQRIIVFLVGHVTSLVALLGCLLQIKGMVPEVFEGPLSPGKSLKVFESPLSPGESWKVLGGPWKSLKVFWKSL